VMKALAKNPENRYANAVEFQQDLQRFLSGQRVHATPLLSEETQIAPALPITETQVLRRDSTQMIPAPERSRTGWYLLSALAILIIFGLVAWLLFNNLLSTNSAPKVLVPTVVGKDVGAAKKLLQNHHLVADVHKQRSNKPVGLVLAQDPPAGNRLERRSHVTLTVSGGPGQTQVPDVSGQKIAEAERTLKEHHLKLGTQTPQPSDVVPKGSIISQKPPLGSTVARGSSVSVVVSSGTETVPVPSVIGLSQDDAIKTLHAAGFHVSVNELASDTVDQGKVISQDPAGGSDEKKGSTVTILVSQGPQAQPLPDVTGQPADEAQQLLEQNYGLSVTQQPYEHGKPCTVPSGSVCAEDPKPGTQISAGDAVILFVQP
jgi:eukaryotic-like serine/threonine-protein kinase